MSSVPDAEQKVQDEAAAASEKGDTDLVAGDANDQAPYGPEVAPNGEGGERYEEGGEKMEQKGGEQMEGEAADCELAQTDGSEGECSDEQELEMHA